MDILMLGAGSFVLVGVLLMIGQGAWPDRLRAPAILGANYSGFILVLLGVLALLFADAFPTTIELSEE